MIAGVVVLGGIYLLETEKIQYTQNEPTVIEKEVKVERVDDAIKTAQTAELARIEGVAQEAYNKSYDHEMDVIELRVRTEYRDKENVVITDLEKETKVY